MAQKKSGVEWIVQQIESGKINIVYSSDKIHSIKCSSDILKQAKEIERKQHGETWDAALDAGQNRAWNVMRAYEDFDYYFAENYGR